MSTPRVFKFKCWDVKAKEFIADGEAMDLYYSAKANAFMFDNDNHDLPKDVIFLQFTGHIDKNGVDIFEGDIKRDTIEYDEGDEIYYFVCTWVHEWTMFAWLSTTDGEYEKYLSHGAEALDTTMYWSYPLEKGEKITTAVCGNIYQRPELLLK
jgi:uncharacterized phage protein (TIGR01671 family)